MINRVLIRTRVLQVAYAHLHRGELRLSSAEQDLLLSLSRTYDLYLYLLRLIPSLTDLQREILEIRKRKHLATSVERSPNMRLVDNRLAEKLSSSEKLTKWYEGAKLSWEDDEPLLRHLLRQVESSDLYLDYMESEDSSFEADQSFWVEAFHQIIAPDELLAERLEQQSIYWQNDLVEIEKIECEERPKTDEASVEEVIKEAQGEGRYQRVGFLHGPVEVVKDFVEKTLRRIEFDGELDDQILPMFKDEDDEHFARMLFRQALVKYADHVRTIEPVLSSAWSSERLADTDALLLTLGLTEFLYFPSIPTSITINEYVELAKHYSTSHSAGFVNGVLDALAKSLKEDGKILKQ